VAEVLSKAALLIVSPDAAERAGLRALLDIGIFRIGDCAPEVAVEAAQALQPCAVLIDEQAVAPGRCALMDAIGQVVEDDYLTFVVLTDATNETLLTACAQCGADDFLLRPYRPVVTQTKLAAIVRERKLQRRLRQQQRELRYHQAVLEREREIAERIFASLSTQRGFQANNLVVAQAPMSMASGDLALAGQKPNGDQRVLLGDFTGHGLAAAIGALPVSEIFYSMTTMGFPLGDMVTVMNRRLKELLPTGIFLALSIVEFDLHKQCVRVWNGGLPDVLVQTGRGLRRIASRHLPLAIVDSAQLGKEVEELRVERGDRIYLYSDGLIEATNPAGEPFGQARLERVVQETPGGAMVQIWQGVMDFIDSAERRDDISLIELQCDPELVAEDYSVRPA